jgi:hypothetical protein
MTNHSYLTNCGFYKTETWKMKQDEFFGLVFCFVLFFKVEVKKDQKKKNPK